MIGRLTGVVDSIGDDWVIIDVGGVGYEVTCSARTLGALPARGERASLAIETHVRETEIRLFGFLDAGERVWFRLLQSVQGVGAKVALAIMGTFSVEDLANAIALADKAMIARAPGVGPKVAGRIVSELEGKAPALGAGGIAPHPAAPGDGAGAAMADAVSALVNLGYGQSEARIALATVMKAQPPDTPPEILIRLGLKALAK